MNKHLFGTDGIRGKVGEFPFTRTGIINIGHSIGKWTTEKFGSSLITLATDTRNSKDFIKTSLSTALIENGHSIHDFGIVSTPMLYYLTHTTQAHIGIMISASHNIYHDNGIKIFIRSKGKLDLYDEKIISEYFYTTYQESNKVFGSYTYAADGISIYRNYITSLFPHINLLGKKIVIDCAHGAISHYIYEILNQFNAEILIINNTPDGFNINDQCGATYPQALQKTVIHHHADIGFAVDGDADRIIACNKDGEIKNGDHLLALLIHHPRYKKIKKVVGTIMSNKGFELYLKQHNISLIRTPVGDKYIMHMLHQEQLPLGGESSGHIILNDIICMGDAIINMCMILETIMINHNWLLNTFISMSQWHHALPITDKKDLNSPTISSIIHKHEKQLKEGRIIVRYSGTESVLRIMIEDIDQQYADQVGTSLVHHLKQLHII